LNRPVTPPPFSKLPRAFYLRSTLTVASDLLGRYLVKRTRTGRLVGKIVEVEAYLGALDPASHSYNGKTPRNEVMFDRGGHLYVYFTYGMHFCSNVVTGEEGTGHAVLLRAVEPLEGIDAMRKSRGLRNSGKPESLLTNGPAKLCQAFSIGRKENGLDLLGETIFLAKGEPCPPSSIVRSRRIGIRKAVEHRWRFFEKGNPFVSRP
jgi:DNA-3-methyladenine glycosylase